MSAGTVRIEGIHHHSVVVSDLRRAVAFYRDVLGLQQVPTPPTFRFAVAWFSLGDGQQIHLLWAPEAEGRGQRHIALHTADTAAARERLRALGCAVEETTPIPGADRFFTEDPDGNRIELIRWERPWDDTVRALGLRAPAPAEA